MSGLGKGLSNLGHSMKDKSTSFGHSVKDKGSSLGLSVKDHAYRRKHYSVDDDLLHDLYHNLKQTLTALKYLSAQTDRFLKKYWPHVFASMAKATRGFLDLTGENSLEFKGIDEYYDAFDKILSFLELFAMHPKERQTTIPSINFALTNFLFTVDQMREKVALDSSDLAKLVRLKNDEMRLQLKLSMNLMKLRTKRKLKYDDLNKKTQKLMKKNVPLEAKEQKELETLGTKSREAESVYENINSRLKLILPEILALLEEYVDMITKLIVSSHTQTYKQIVEEIHDFMEFHGFPHDDMRENLEEYQAIMDAWETAVTPTRLRIESFVSSIKDRHPDRIDEDIEDKDKSSKMYKAWLLATLKVTDKLHKVKPKDHVNGIFGEYMTADPLQSFLKYETEDMNQSERYHPHKMLKATDVHVPERDVKAPPPLPPRDDLHPIALSPHIGVMPSPHTGHWNDYEDSIDQDSDTDLSLSSDRSDDEKSILSSDMLAVDVSPDKSIQKLKNIYNESKNDILETPITTTKWPHFSTNKNVFDKTFSTSYKLIELNKFFESALSSLDAVGSEEQWVATKDFEGREPGDLSFKEGDVLEVILNLQNFNISHRVEGGNWFVGATEDMKHRRIGFAPSSYFTKR